MEGDAPTVFESREEEGEQELYTPTPNDNPAIPTKILTQLCITRFIETLGTEVTLTRVFVRNCLIVKFDQTVDPLEGRRMTRYLNVLIRKGS